MLFCVENFLEQNIINIADDGKIFIGSGVGDPFGPRCHKGTVLTSPHIGKNVRSLHLHTLAKTFSFYILHGCLLLWLM